MNTFTYNSTASSAYGIKVEYCPDYYVPQREQTRIHVPGRDGDLVLDTGAYKNFDRSYDIYFNAKSSKFQTVASSVVTWLCGTGGYHCLEDTYETDIYMMAMVENQSALSNFMNYMGRARVTFNCKPQKWLKSGETEVTLTSGATTSNAYMPCFPVFRLTGNGTLTVNGNTITVTNNSGKTITIDCETQNAYTGTDNRNADITVTGDFPYLKSGNNTITFTNSTCKMTPRWWRL